MHTTYKICCLDKEMRGSVPGNCAVSTCLPEVYLYDSERRPDEPNARKIMLRLPGRHEKRVKNSLTHTRTHTLIYFISYTRFTTLAFLQPTFAQAWQPINFNGVSHRKRCTFSKTHPAGKTISLQFPAPAHELGFCMRYSE